MFQGFESSWINRRGLQKTCVRGVGTGEVEMDQESVKDGYILIEKEGNPLGAKREFLNYLKTGSVRQIEGMCWIQIQGVYPE